MAKKINSRSTKAEILEAFEELKKEKSSLESQLKKTEKEKKEIASNPLAAAQQTTPSAEVKPKMNAPKTAKDKMHQTIESLQLLQLGFGSAVSELSEQLTAEASKLSELQASVSEEIEELEALHELEVEENTLDTLLESYQERSKQFDSELTQQRETLEQQIQDLNKNWKKEKETHTREIQERNREHQQSQQRDEEEYRYDLQLARDLDKEEYEQRKQALYQELEEARETQEKEWEEREKAIAEREKQQAEAKAKVEAHEKELETNIKNGKDNGRNIGNYQAKVAADLRAKEVEGATRSYELRINSLQQSIQNQEARIQSLNKQLEGALKQVQDLAVKAIEGTANSNSLQAIKEIAVEQARNQQKNK
ncbi:hypothetical protein JJD41_21135 [Oxynema sp. CENA135]|uniref:hypothetical protein n=1 Tax=Oxynema sp. CENA135 TaxID=984206 RepID=UPI00190DC75B|nr:hypothetical protein [Oxynema sp. CENA135]MBK4732351.1 hypothetical protein [Oxynema sp. CENA135]